MERCVWAANCRLRSFSALRLDPDTGGIVLVPEDIVFDWTLVDEDRRLIANKAGATRLGFAVILKYFQLHGQFPRSARQLPRAAVGYVARQVQIPAAALREYRWDGRSAKRHRMQVRDQLGFREASRADEDRLATWLAQEVAPTERSDERLREALLTRCRQERIEPPGRVQRIVTAARATSTAALCARTVDRLTADAAERLEQLAEPSDGWRGALAEIKAGPGQPSLKTLLAEVRRLQAVRVVGLPDGLFDEVPDAQLAAWRARAAVEYPSDLRRHPRPLRLTLLAVLCHCRRTEITDSLVELLIGVVHKVNTRAERRVEGELLHDLRRVRGKEGILFRVAETALDHPDDTVRAALYPVVGEATLRQLVREAKSNEASFRARVRTVLRSSYSTHYRRMLPPLLDALTFRSNNTAHRPLIDALALLASLRRCRGVVPLLRRDRRRPHSTTSSPPSGETRWSTNAAWSNAFPSSCAPCAPCATGCVAAKSGWRGPGCGATPNTTCPPTSRRTATSTTARCADRWTPPSSSPTSSNR